MIFLRKLKKGRKIILTREKSYEENIGRNKRIM